MTDVQHIHEDGHPFDATTLMGHIVADHADVTNDDLYVAIRKGDTEVRALHSRQHPEGRPAKVRFKWFLHYDEVRGLEDYLADPPAAAKTDPIPADLAREIAEAKPFYEVTMYVSYDTVTKKFTLIEAKLNG